MQQLKEMEGVYGVNNDTQSPRSELDRSGKQIKMVSMFDITLQS